MLHQVGVSFDLYYDARKHKIKIYYFVHFNALSVLITSRHLLDWITLHNVHGETPDPNKRQVLRCPVHIIVQEALYEKKYEQS